MARGCGAEVRIADIFDAKSLATALDGCATVINLATSLPGPSGRGDFAANDVLRRQGTPILLGVCRQVGTTRFLQQSVAMVSGAGDALTDEESSPLRTADNPVASAATDAALAMEDAVRASGLDWIVLRGGLFYGPGTGFDDDWFARAAGGKLRLPGDGSDYVSLVHIADMAAATVNAIQRWPSRQTIIVADDAPARWRDVFGYIAECAGAAPPPPGGRAGFPSFRVSNRKARALLDWAPRYADFRAGLVR